MRDVTLVKLGGSLLTEKARPETARPAVIARLAAEIAAAAPRLAEPLIIAHGSGSFGHVAARRHGIAGGLRSAEQPPASPSPRTAPPPSTARWSRRCSRPAPCPTRSPRRAAW